MFLSLNQNQYYMFRPLKGNFQVFVTYTIDIDFVMHDFMSHLLTSHFVL
jgi:hypothetical protein